MNMRLPDRSWSIRYEVNEKWRSCHYGASSLLISTPLIAIEIRIGGEWRDSNGNLMCGFANSLSVAAFGSSRTIQWGERSLAGWLFG